MPRAGRPVLAALLALAAAAGCAHLGVSASGQAPRFDPTGSDPRALALADQMVAAMGGMDAWNRVAQLKWEYVVDDGGVVASDVLHAWDRKEARHTMESWFKDKLVVVMQHLDDPSHGYVTLAQRRLASDDAEPFLAEAETRFHFSSFTLAAPFLLRAPGAHLSYGGPARLDDDPTRAAVPVDVLEVVFDAGAGERAGDHYWFYLDRQTHLPLRWDYVLGMELDNDDTGKPPPRTAARWERWQQVGPVKLSLKREFLKGAIEVRFENVTATATVDDELFVPYTTNFEHAFGTGTPTAPTPGPGNGPVIIQ